MGSFPSVEHSATTNVGSQGIGRTRSSQGPHESAGNLGSPTSSAVHDRGDSSNGALHRPGTAIRTKKHVKGRVVFLGLDGAGKTTLLKQLQRLATLDNAMDTVSHHEFTTSESARTPSPMNMLQSVNSTGDLMTSDGTRIPRIFPDPTKTTTSVIYPLDDRYIQLVDVPGRRVYRTRHWRTALMGDAPVGSITNGPTPLVVPIVGVVFVVDATDHTRFPLVARELVAFQKLKETRAPNGTLTPLASWLQRAPFLMVLNKVDTAAGGSNASQNINSIERRRASRMMRQQLKFAFDHQLRMDQKKSPKDYASVVNVASSNREATSTPTSSAPPPSSKKRAALAEANNNRKTLLMTSLVECCAFDHDCVRAIHTLLRDDIRRLWSGV